jgi:hypothetical protein
MSFEAQQWAVQQRCGNLSRKAVLMILANVADGDGFVRSVRVEYLQWTTELSRRTIYRELRELENGGALTRDRGHNDDGRTASCTLNLTGIFKLRKTPETAEMRETEKDSAMGGTKQSAMDGTKIDKQSAMGGTEQSANGDTSLYWDKLYNIPSTTTLVSPSPARASQDDQPSEANESPKGAFDGFQELLRSYPFDSTMGLDEAERLFDALSVKDRLKAIRFAKIYAGDLKRRGRSQPRDIAAWLKSRAFDRIAASMDEKARSAGLKNAQVFVARGTDAWKAWASTRAKPFPVSEHGGKTGWWFASLYPPRATGPPAASSGVGEKESLDSVEF